MRAIGATVAAIVLALIVAVVLWVVNLAGNAAGVANRTFDPDNMIQEYEQFHDRCAAIQRYETSISTQEELLESAEDSGERTRIRTNIGGLKAQRQGAISQYNADSTKTNVGIFQGRTLPQKLDPDTPTVCGEY